MKHFIRDTSQIVVAILLTTSLVVVNAAPMKQKPTKNKPVPIAVITKIAPVVPQPVPAVVSPPETVQPTVPAQTPVTTAPVTLPPVYSGSHEDWMIAAGIDPSDYAAVDYIVSHESSWNPNATEPTSGAHGLPQALPYSKTGCDRGDPICQLKWASNYASVRYGGWQQAAAYWQTHRYW